MTQKNQPTLSRKEVRHCDTVAIERYSIPGIVLMENAGRTASEIILAQLPQPTSANVAIIAGTGNNGGDGFVVARHLSNCHIKTKVLICGSRDRIRGDALTNLIIIEKMALDIEYTSNSPAEQIAQLASNADTIVDAMLGTGTAGPPRQPIRTAIETINALKKTVIALDIPSGLDCDTGEPLEIAITAAQTVTFAAMKKGFLLKEAQKFTGQVTVASIGIDTNLLVQ